MDGFSEHTRPRSPTSLHRQDSMKTCHAGSMAVRYTSLTGSTSRGSGTEVTLLAMNLSGRFAGREIRRFGEAVLGTVLVEKDADLMFGQQTNFKPRLPEHYTFIGGTKAFLAFNSARIKAADEKQFRCKLRDLQFTGKLPFHYLPLSNFTINKFKTRRTPCIEFVAVSWLSDETNGRLRNVSLFKKLMSFIVNVSALEELPVVMAGTFNISLEEASNSLPPDYCVYGYIPYNVRRQIRAADFFVCPRAVRLGNVRPILTSHLRLDERSDMWLNPEDAFYCDPVRATLVAERQQADAKLHAHKYDQDELVADDLDDDNDQEECRDEPEGGRDSPMVPHGGENKSELPQQRKALALDLATTTNAEAEASNLRQGLLKKLPSCPELYDDNGAENGTTCYMS